MSSREPPPRAERHRILELLSLEKLRDRSGALLRMLDPFFPAEPLELRIVGRALLHAGLVGAIAGVLGAAFFAALELGQAFFLERLVGFEPLRAQGERFVAPGASRSFLPLLLPLLPMAGALASGLLTSRLAPEAAGGGGDAAIEAYHHGRVVRARVIPVKGLAAFFALSTGGSGGREGPTMQIGAAIGALVARFLPTTRAERRVLLDAGIAAGISAVFRTPLGAALLATEMLYRDDFDAEALVPAIFASVISYSVVIALFGETTLFGPLARFPFTVRHLPLYALAAVVVSFAAYSFVKLLRWTQRTAAALIARPWLRPAVGGLAMGLVGTALALWMEAAHGAESRGFGVFGGGYGTLQEAMSGAAWLPGGVRLAGLLVVVAVAKMVASALTIGSGAAAGDFAPSLVIGGLLGSAFGHAAGWLFGDPSIEPAAFALVGMGTFYGGLAHAPLAALVLVAELAGSYDLLVPMMLAIGIAYVALRRHSLYPAQLPSRMAAAPAAGTRSADALTGRPIAGAVVAARLGGIPERATLADLGAVVEEAPEDGAQRVLVVEGPAGPKGLLELAIARHVPPADRTWVTASDAMVPFVSVTADATWGTVAGLLERSGLSQIPVVAQGAVVGWIGDGELRRAVLGEVSVGDARDA